MHVYATIITVFAEMFVFVMSVAAFLLLAHAYSERRTVTLLAYGGAFLAMTFAIVSLFFGHVSGALNGYASATNMFRASFAFAAVAGLQFCVAASWHLSLFWRRAVLIAASLLALNGVMVASSADIQIAYANGITFPNAPSAVLLAMLSTLALFSLVSVLRTTIFARAAHDKGKSPAPGARKLFLLAGILGLVFVVMAVAQSRASEVRLIPFTFILLFASLGLTAVAAATVDSPDEEVRRNPLMLVRRSLLLKVGSVNALVVWVVVAFALLAFYPPHVASERQQREDALRRDVHFFLESYRARGATLLSEADTIAHSSIAKRLVSQDAAADGSLLDVVGVSELWSDVSVRLIRVVDASGVIRYSTYSHSETGTPHFVSPVLNGALEGRHITSWERSQTFGTWAVRSAVPINDSEGKVIGAVIASEIDRTFVADDSETLSQLASGYGLIAPDGQSAFTTGQVLTEEDRSALRSTRLGGGVTDLRLDGKQVFVATADDDIGESAGIFYAHISDRDENSRILLGIAKIAGYAYAGIGIMAALLISAMTSILRPLRAMRDAAHRLGSGQAMGRVTYDGPDEIGQLAAAFNATIDIVDRRTDELTTAVRERRDFLEHAARELRTPLSVFRWTLETMRFGETGTFTKEQLDHLERLHQTNQRLEKMVDNLRDVSQVDRKGIQIRRQLTAIEDLVDNVAGEVSVAARMKGVELKWTRPDKKLPRVQVDPDYVQKALHNIVENAVKYTQAHGAVQVSAERGEPGFVVVTVKDSGIGIPTDERTRVFSRFFRAQNVSEFEIEGAGLGLYLAKRFIEMHGGTISLASQEGLGTVVTITLPTEHT